MITWTQEQDTQFLEAIASFWPGGWADRGQRSEKAKTWLMNARSYNPRVAVEGLRELYEASEASRLPSLATAHEVWRRIQGFVRRRASEAASAPAGPAVSPQEIAADDQFWLDMAEKYHGKKTGKGVLVTERQKRWRECMRQGEFPAELFGGKIVEETPF